MMKGKPKALGCSRISSYISLKLHSVQPPFLQGGGGWGWLSLQPNLKKGGRLDWTSILRGGLLKKWGLQVSHKK